MIITISLQIKVSGSSWNRVSSWVFSCGQYLERTPTHPLNRYQTINLSNFRLEFCKSWGEAINWLENGILAIFRTQPYSHIEQISTNHRSALIANEKLWWKAIKKLEYWQHLERNPTHPLDRYQPMRSHEEKLSINQKKAVWQNLEKRKNISFSIEQLSEISDFFF